MNHLLNMVLSGQDSYPVMTSQVVTIVTLTLLYKRMLHAQESRRNLYILIEIA